MNNSEALVNKSNTWSLYKMMFYCSLISFMSREMLKSLQVKKLRFSRINCIKWRQNDISFFIYILNRMSQVSSVGYLLTLHPNIPDIVTLKLFSSYSRYFSLKGWKIACSHFFTSIAQGSMTARLACTGIKYAVVTWYIFYTPFFPQKIWSQFPNFSQSFGSNPWSPKISCGCDLDSRKAIILIPDPTEMRWSLIPYSCHGLDTIPNC